MSFVLGGAVLVLAGCVCVACVDADSPGCAGAVVRFLLVTLPRALTAGLTALRLRWLLDGAVAAFDWFAYKRHPLIQIAYVALVFGGYGAFVLHGYPHMPNRYMGGYHKWLGAVNFAVCVVTFAAACFSDPGVVTAANASALASTYPPDGFMYAAAPRDCPTCRVTKPARSKHCRVCDRCVSKFDHHCIWLNNCVGERNYRWFLSYLIANTVLLAYGTAACVSVLASIVMDNRLMEATFVNKVTGERVPPGAAIVAQYLLFTNLPVVSVLLLCAVMGAVLAGFTAYHLYLAATAFTTNETVKWREAEDAHAAAVAQYERAAADYARMRAAVLVRGGVLDEDADGVARPPPSVLECLEGRCAHAEHAGNAGRTAARWTLRPPPPMPRTTAYDRGWRANLRDAFWPPSLYPRRAAVAAAAAAAPAAAGVGKKRT